MVSLSTVLSFAWNDLERPWEAHDMKGLTTIKTGWIRDRHITASLTCLVSGWKINFKCFWKMSL